MPSPPRPPQAKFDSLRAVTAPTHGRDGWQAGAGEDGECANAWFSCANFAVCNHARFLRFYFKQELFMIQAGGVPGRPAAARPFRRFH